jgi:hypothetical protein
MGPSCKGRQGGLQASLLIKLEKFDRGSILDNKSDGHTRGWRVGRNEYLFSGDFGGEIIHFEGNMRNIAHQVRNLGFRLEAHPLDAVGAGFISRDEGGVTFDQVFPFSTLGRGDSDVMVPPGGSNW